MCDGGGGDSGGGGGDFGSNGNGNDYGNNNSHYGHHDHNDHQNHYGGEPGVKKFSDLPFCIQIGVPSCFMLVALSVGIGLLVRAIEFTSKYENVVGLIIATESCGCSGSSGSCSATYRPVIEYYVDDTRYEFTTDSCSNPAPRVGRDIKVLYDPMDPGEAVSGTFVSLWMTPIIAIPIGIACCGFICSLIFKKIVNKPEPPPGTDSGNLAMSNFNGQPEQVNAPPPVYNDPYTSTSSPEPSAFSAPPPAYNDQYATASVPVSDSSPYTTTASANTSGGTPSLFDQMKLK